jgi:hypothetical protein
VSECGRVTSRMRRRRLTRGFCSIRGMGFHSQQNRLLGEMELRTKFLGLLAIKRLYKGTDFGIMLCVPEPYVCIYPLKLRP